MKKKQTDSSISALDMKKMISFVQAATKNCIEPGKGILYTCPLCGGKVSGLKSALNGHVMAHCTGCKTTIRS